MLREAFSARKDAVSSVRREPESLQPNVRSQEPEEAMRRSCGPVVLIWAVFIAAIAFSIYQRFNPRPT